MNIVILDGKSTNPGDLSWAPLQTLGNVTVFDNLTDENEIVQKAESADAIILCRVPMSAKTISSLPNLKYIGTLATGYNTIDLDAADKAGVAVCNVPFYCIESVSQHVFALLLALTNQVTVHSSYVMKNEWTQAVQKSSSTLPILELAGKTLGIFGYGNIGSATAKIGEAFGMRILTYSRTKKNPPANYEQTDMETLFKESDVISVHCPLTPETQGIIDYSLLSKMKKTAFLINTARGAVINETDLANALNNGILAGAGLDVLSTEPPPANHPLLSAENCIITPHISWSSKDARSRLIDLVADNLSSHFSGNTKNLVNNPS